MRKKTRVSLRIVMGASSIVVGAAGLMLTLYLAINGEFLQDTDEDHAIAIVVFGSAYGVLLILLGANVVRMQARDGASQTRRAMSYHGGATESGNHRVPSVEAEAAKARWVILIFIALIILFLFAWRMLLSS